MLAKIKTGEAAARRDYRMQLAIERLTGLPTENGSVSKDMQRGIDLESAALAAYEAEAGVITKRTGFLQHNGLMIGASLDAHVGKFRGNVEVKCPKSTTHIGYLKAGVFPPEYLPQAMLGMLVDGADWCDLASFDDRLPTELQLFLVRVWRKDVDMAAFEKSALAFLAEVDAEVESLQALRRPLKAAA
jgi:hypothetical protein